MFIFLLVIVMKPDALPAYLTAPVTRYFQETHAPILPECTGFVSRCFDCTVGAQAVCIQKRRRILFKEGK